MKIAILTSFNRSRPGYAIYNVVHDQAVALAEPGNDIHIVTTRDFSPEEFGFDHKYPIEVHPILPSYTGTPLIDYTRRDDLTQEHLHLARQISSVLRDEVTNLRNGFDAVFTHDWVFTGWHLPFFLAIEELASENKDIKWLHWVHSLPGGQPRDWWHLRLLGERRHRIVWPNNVDRVRVAGAFDTDVSKVVFIPHIVDIRDISSFSSWSRNIIDEFPALMDATVVQVYPASADRLDDKGVRELVLLFAEIKRRGFSTCLCIADSHADTLERRGKIEHYERIARRNGLEPGYEFIFLSNSEHMPVDGIPRHVLFELLSLSTICIVPSQIETFGLAWVETILASGALAVLNKSLPVMTEISGSRGLLTDFGSYCADWVPKHERVWIEALAGIIVAQLTSEESSALRIRLLKRLNRNKVYNDYYVPILERSAIW